MVALLSDLYGIQARGGCACAEPYGHKLLGIDIQQARSFGRGLRGLRPGWTRVSFAYTMRPAEVRYVVEAVRQIAAHGWRLQGEYALDAATGEWHHRAAPPLLHLADLRYAAAPVEMGEAGLPGYLSAAREVYRVAPAMSSSDDSSWFVTAR